MIGIKIQSPVSQDPGTISKLFELNSSVWHKHQPDMVRYYGYLSGGQDVTVSGDTHPPSDNRARVCVSTSGRLTSPPPPRVMHVAAGVSNMN